MSAITHAVVIAVLCTFHSRTSSFTELNVEVTSHSVSIDPLLFHEEQVQIALSLRPHQAWTRRWMCRWYPNDCHPAIQDIDWAPATSLTSSRTCRPHRTPARSPASAPARSPLWRTHSSRFPCAAAAFWPARSVWRQDHVPGPEMPGSGWRSACARTLTGSTGLRSREPRPLAGHTPDPKRRTCCIC